MVQKVRSGFWTTYYGATGCGEGINLTLPVEQGKIAHEKSGEREEGDKDLLDTHTNKKLPKLRMEPTP